MTPNSTSLTLSACPYALSQSAAMPGSSRSASTPPLTASTGTLSSARREKRPSRVSSSRGGAAVCCGGGRLSTKHQSPPAHTLVAARCIQAMMTGTNGFAAAPAWPASV